MPFSVRPSRRFTMFCAQLISQNCLRGGKQAAYILLILVLASCVGRNGDSRPVSQQAECLSGTNGSCFYWKEPSSETNEKLIIFVHGVFSTSADTWGDVKAGNTWPELVRGDDKFKDYDIYLVNYRTSYITSAPNIYQIAKRELERLKDKGIFKDYKEIYFIAHSMGGLVTKNLLKQLNRREDEPLLRQVRGVVYLGTPSRGVGVATLAKWLSFNPQLGAMEPEHLNQWILELEDDWIRLMDERGESPYPQAFCAYEIRPYLRGYIVVPSEAARSRCDIFTGLDLDHSDLAVPARRENDQYEWVMARIRRTSELLVNIDNIKLQVLFECEHKRVIKIVPHEGGPKVVLLQFRASDSPYRAINHALSIDEFTGIPNVAGVVSDPEKDGRVVVCQITNYEKYTLINIELDFQLRFKDTPKQAALPGVAIKSELPWILTIDKVEAGEKFVFHLINYSDCYLEADYPDWLYFRRRGEFQKRTVRLSTLHGRGTMMFGPLKHPMFPKECRL